MKQENDFMAFFAQYNKACRDKDRTFLKSILPANIPADQFEFVLNMSYLSTIAIDESGVKPIFRQTGNMMEAIYEGDLGDGMTTFIMDFYLINNQWLKYNPAE
ncbi:MAG: hypothetical protein AB9846_00505 [Tenuifilaceae bacterium]